MRRVQELQSLWRGAASALKSARSKSDIAVANGVPQAIGRKVTIFSPARTAGQQGISLTAEGGGPAWKIEFDTQSKWINPLIGWTSSADPMDSTGHPLYFTSKEAAVAFAERNGWEWEVEDYNIKSRARPRRYLGYGDNFSVKRKGLPQGGLRSEQASQQASKK